MSEPQVTTGTEVPSHEAEPVAFGFLTAPMSIALAILVVIGIMVWKKVPGAIAGALDSKIALIRDQLAEAETLRKEAEALKAEYEAKAAQADAEAATMIERAHTEAQGIVAQAEADADALVERRARMAEDKIAAAERAAIEEVRAKAATAATAAAESLIREKLDAAADKPMVDATIAGLARR